MTKKSSTTNGSYIDLTTAAGMTANFQSQYPDNAMALLFDADLIAGILEQDGTVGIRIYLGIDSSSSEEQITPVIVGVDSDGNDQTDGYIADMGNPCPPGCSNSNPLNGGTTDKPL